MSALSPKIQIPHFAGGGPDAVVPWYYTAPLSLPRFFYHINIMYETKVALGWSGTGTVWDVRCHCLRTRDRRLNWTHAHEFTFATNISRAFVS